MIPVNGTLLTGNEKKYLNECIDTGWISSEGPFVKKFEEGIANYTNRRHGIAVSSGSSALEMAVLALGIGHGDEVIVPTLTIISCINAIVRSGAVPVLVDSDAKTFNMDPLEVSKKISKKTKAIMVVHLYGLPCDMNPLIELAKENKLKIIEDAAEILGQTYFGKKCGSFGDVSVFSFYANKIVTTGEGGMVVTDNEEVASRCRSLRNLGFSTERRFLHETSGWNYRMTNLQAALGVAQLEQLETFIEKKRWIGNTYNKLLSDLGSIQLPVIKTDYAENIYWVYSIVLKNESKLEVEDVRKMLKENGVDSRTFFWPMHEQPVFNKNGLFVGERYFRAETLSRRGLYLPSGLSLKIEQITEVANVLIKVLS